MIKRIITTTLITMIFCTVLSSCHMYDDYVKPERDTQDGIQNSSMFVVIEEAMNYKIVYHKNTKVMYTISNGGYNSGNFTLLVNADGTPMIFEKE